MDVLSDVLAAVRLNGAIFFDIDAGTPWVGETPPAKVVAPAIMPGADHVIMFHLVMSGECWAALGEGAQAPVRLSPGDVVVFPRGHANVMSSAPGARGATDMSLYHRPVDSPLPFRLRHGGEGPERTRFVCGFLGCDARPFNPLLSALPAMILYRAPDDGSGWALDLFRMALAEGSRPRAGAETVLAKLSELMFVDTVRRYLETLPGESRSWLSGLRDPHVGQALLLIHSQPTREWTLEELARHVGLSRSGFADRFASFVDMSPMQYIARWRMQLAAALLEQSSVSIAQAAAEVGYESEAAFNRAFKKLIGIPPGAWRRSRRAVPGSAPAM
jgi:AraC-like DNA-binding protein